MHPTAQGVVLRAMRPDAAQLELLTEDGTVVPVPRTHVAGLFERTLPGMREVRPYRLRWHLDGGEELIQRYPYNFLPTLGELDLHLLGEGRHEHLHDKLGARFRTVDGVDGFAFAVWAPGAAGVSVVGDFNAWDGRIYPMRMLGGSGVWELFIPHLEPGHRYKFELRTRDGGLLMKADPYALATEVPPGSASVLHRPAYHFQDEDWVRSQARLDSLRRPLSIYEVHAGSWRRVPEEGHRSLSYRELASALADHVTDLGFTHVQFLPLMEHPFGGSWGYQLSAYFAPTARYGNPDDFRYLVDHLHQRGLGVILDWVPAHFPKDEFALGRFDGTALYEHLDPRQGEHPDWGTFIFNYGRNEVRNFLLASALQWLEHYHVDGLRVDAVASMLYLDYSRKPGQWVPNKYGGRENLDAIEFLKYLNEVVHRRFPAVLMCAEESTAWGGVSRPTYAGGLGFGFKWNMGWMHDTLLYFTRDPIYRKYHHGNLTFGLLYAWSENFILPLSHDEVVHGKASLLSKMPGDRWQKFANLRALYGHMWAHPGRKLLFMGGEFGQWNEWHHESSLDWHLLAGEEHRGLMALVRDLNRLYRHEPALWEADSEHTSFQWIDVDNAQENVLAYLRIAPRTGSKLLCVCNFSPVVRHGYRVGLPAPGQYHEVLNTDAAMYGGSNIGNAGAIRAEHIPWHGRPWSAPITLPPLAVLWFECPKG
jgi:1,4-alpha-glucan branching enzyme